MQKTAIVIALVLAGVNCGCSSREMTLAQLDGSEPQRLSSGDPKTVQADYAGKANLCWLGGATPLLQGYRLETATLTNVAGVPAEEAGVPHIRVFAPESPNRTAFEVEFHPFHENTLISTRNLSLPADVASRLKRDVETWMLGEKGCGSTGAGLTVAERRLYDPKPTGSVRPQPASWTPPHSAVADAGGIGR